MAAKFDKELLKKHHFWFLFIPIAISVLLAVYGLAVEVPSDIADVQKKHETDANKEKNRGNQLPRKALDEFDKQLRELDVQRVRMWKEGWAEQKDLFVWPEGYTKQQRAVFEPLKFGDDVPDVSVRDQFKGQAVYENEYKTLIDSIEPIQFKDNRWQKVLAYKDPWGGVPSSEDLWLAMEDLWLQRQLLLAIHRVNVDAAKFALVNVSGDSALHRHFRSRLWEVELEVVPGKDNKQILKGKLKNVSGRLLVMGVGNVMKLRVMLSGEPFILEAEGEPVENEKTIEIYTVDKNKHMIKGRRVSEIDGVEQIFDARSAPVKRIEAVGLLWPADRFKDVPLKMAPFSKALAEKDAPPPSATTPGTTTAPPPTATDPNAPAPTNADGTEVPVTVAAAPALPAFSANNFSRNRYVDVTEQIRRLPFSIVITTDQSFMKDIVESILTIKLRPQITQLEWIRFHDTLDYNANLLNDPNRKRDGPNNNRDDQFSANLMQMSLYGIVTFFEKVPDESRPAPPPAKFPAKDLKETKK